MVTPNREVNETHKEYEIVIEKNKNKRYIVCKTELILNRRCIMAKKTKEKKSKTKEEKPKIAEEKPKIAEEEPKIAEEEPKITEEKRIILFIEWEGFTKEMYEEARKQVNLDGDIPKGLVSHFVAFDKKDIRVTDIWESEEEFNNYIQNRLMPVTGNLIETKPKIEIFPLYTLFVPVKESS